MASRPSEPCSALLFGGFIVQLDHHAIGVIDENLPEIAAGHLPHVERHAFGLKPLLHAGKIAARESDMMHNAGIGLLLLVRSRNINEMDHRLAPALNPSPGKRKIRPVAVLQSQDLLIKPNRVGVPPGPKVEIIKHAFAHAMSLPLT